MRRQFAASRTLSLFVGDSPVRTSQAPATEEGSVGSAPGSGTGSRGTLSARARAGSSSKTSRAAPADGSQRSATPWPAWAIVHAPWGLPQATLERCIVAVASSWLPTLLASDEKRGSASVTLRAAVLALLPTLTTARNILSPAMQKWPAHRRMLPTMTATSYGSNQGEAAGREGQEPRPSLRGLAGGSLNPTWCEWFMGFPEGWTELDAEASETRSCLSARASWAKSSGRQKRRASGEG